MMRCIARAKKKHTSQDHLSVLSWPRDLHSILPAETSELIGLLVIFQLLVLSYLPENSAPNAA
jgi:hypothetical protein